MQKNEVVSIEATSFLCEFISVLRDCSVIELNQYCFLVHELGNLVPIL